ncbi:LacI family DNA-binding transcriptional regulator [Zhihengliuella flava]|uniref:DNA-binding LacI/PurR family transcriptional regulator n=1 Tax=Zhihengliuella flava TaxID=1285193 RepID=A0A931DDH8_9MICC|nr:substrate-binding domain-containing protein [Zhihengliuella flava]MBG6085466.1 DNA-binding LacI/PurR family transcriptional regulator [Zhihengliuella flava]
MDRPPSMADVAARAGVSHQTVSRVLNDHPNVRPETRDRVLAAIDDLGYRRNRAARALATARSSTIGILSVGGAYFGPQSTVLAIEVAARSAGYFVSVSSLDGYDSRSAALALDHLMDQGVDGVVVVAPLNDVTQVITEAEWRVPVVVIGTPAHLESPAPVRYVHVDQRLGAQRATEHLIDLGHRRIDHVSGPPGWFDATEREVGWRLTLRAAGVDGDVVPAGDWSAARGYEVGCTIAARIADGRGPSAVFAANDYLAIGLLRAFWERGLCVPDDVSVVGFDDLQSSAYYIPALTTVRQPFAAVGAAAVDALLGTPTGDQNAFAPEIVVRSSTAPPGG